jgi:hypothetical protein
VRPLFSFTGIRNYPPRPVIELFAFKQDPLSIGDGAGPGAGWKFVTNERKIGPTFAIQTDIRAPLMTALSEDLVVLIFSRGNRQQHVVADVLGRHMQAVVMQVRGVEAVRPADQVRLVVLIVELRLHLLGVSLGRRL